MRSAESSQETERRRKRLAAIVGAAAGAVILAVAWSYWRTAGALRQVAPASQPAKNLPAHAEQELSGYTFTRSVGGRRLFTIHAAKTIAFEPAAAGGSTVLQDIRVEFYGPAGNRRDTLRTDQCKYNPQTGALTADGKVDIVLNADALTSSGAPAPASLNAFPGPEKAEQLPVFLETSKVSFEQQGSLVTSDEPVDFRVGGARGHARGIQYAIEKGWLELDHDVTAEFPLAMLAAPGRSGPMAHLSASHLRYDKARNEIALAGPVVITHENERLTSAEAVVRLDSQHRVEDVALSGGVEGRDDLPAKAGSMGGFYQISAPTMHAEFGAASAGNPDHSLRKLSGDGGVQAQVVRQGRNIHLVSQTFEMEFEGISPRPVKGNASGSVRLTLVNQITARPAPGAASNPLAANLSAGLPPAVLSGGEQSRTFTVSATGQTDLTADGMDFSFQPGGPFLSEARTTGRGTLVFHPDTPRQGERDVASTPLVMTFDPRGKLAQLEGLSQSRIIFLPPATAAKGTPADETTSERFQAVFEPASQSLKYLDELGNVQFTEGDRRASADCAHFEAAKNSVELRGAPSKPSGRPVLWDPQTRVAADQVLMNFDKGTFEGRGHLESTQLGDAGNSAQTAAGEPTHILADRAMAGRSTGFVHYEGHVRAWHGANVLECSVLDIWKNQRRISSPLRVETSHLAEQTVAPGQEAKSGNEVRPVVISADRLDYFDEGRKASYRGNVVLKSEGSVVTADALDVYFAPAGGGEDSQIDHAVGTGHVVVVDETRRGTGEHIEYWAKDGKIELTGGPPVLYDPGRDYVTGRRLTFHLADDTVFVDGDARSPTYSKHRIPQ